MRLQATLPIILERCTSPSVRGSGERWRLSGCRPPKWGMGDASASSDPAGAGCDRRLPSIGTCTLPPQKPTPYPCPGHGSDCGCSFVVWSTSTLRRYLKIRWRSHRTDEPITGITFMRKVLFQRETNPKSNLDMASFNSSFRPRQY